MLDIGVPELLIILTIVLLVFGPGRLGEAGGALGKAISEFRRGLQGDRSSPLPTESKLEKVTKGTDEDQA